MKTLEERIAYVHNRANQKELISENIEITHQYRCGMVDGEKDLAKHCLEIIKELQQKNDLLQLDFNAAQEIMGCKNQEIEELKEKLKKYAINND